jgi:hypothetical protein
MSYELDLVEKLTWSIYEWVGAISVTELSTNQKLRGPIEALFKKLASLNTLEAV